MSVPNVDPAAYPALLEAKRDRIETQFARFDPPALEVLASPPTHYRQRVEFRLWHEGDDLFYAMFEPDPDLPGKQRPVRVDTFPVANARINALMEPLRQAIRASDVLRRKIFQIEFLSTQGGETLVSMIYHRQLDEAWEAEARALQQQFDIKIIGRARKQRIVLVDDFVTEHLEVEGKTFHYQQVENSFTQPNAVIAAKMLTWARQATRPRAGEELRDLVELYCGNGNFTVALAENFRRVLGTEISRTSVASAQVNIEANALDNVVVARMSSEDFSQALSGERVGRRAQALALDTYDFSTVLVDPPRAGLDEGSCAEIAKYERIVYISCNPDTLETNLEQLTKTHRVTRLALFDQFPYTHHCECGVLLERR
ncbi:tRNA (uridine(54)-C5)-methyltransferase TrmA [Zymobacter palmae]|uniref:tRNA/tmRNA (uracil-C(5))-methyltransferase n=1 Tax=Zymobacter palmae TaxID=33074 RepID=A0A348HCK7_9GAMM|nr:tRNA (uridine(54)-C5)-methyltransferase TrmA [Zymobacter palmae]BBG29359.1 SAM-dependent methyltransferases related to tRNA [Zymobacter palmae]